MIGLAHGQNKSNIHAYIIYQSSSHCALGHRVFFRHQIILPCSWTQLWLDTEPPRNWHQGVIQGQRLNPVCPRRRDLKQSCYSSFSVHLLRCFINKIVLLLLYLNAHVLGHVIGGWMRNFVSRTWIWNDIPPNTVVVIIHPCPGYIDCLVQDCSNSIANALKLQQSCTKPSI